MRAPTDQFEVRESPTVPGKFYIENEEFDTLFVVDFVRPNDNHDCRRVLIDPEAMIKQIGELMIKSHREGVIEGRCELQRELRRLIGAREC